jgi:hypothetical protein
MSDKASSVWADTAYRSKANETHMEKNRFVAASAGLLSIGTCTQLARAAEKHEGKEKEVRAVEDM